MSTQSCDSNDLHTAIQSDLYFLVEKHGPVMLSMLRSMYQNSDLFDAIDPASSERRFLAALEQLKKDQDVVISGNIPCDQAVISLVKR